MKNVQFINEHDNTKFHLNPKDFITFHECRAHSVWMISIDFYFQGCSFRQQRLLPLDWNKKSFTSKLKRAIVFVERMF